MTVRATPSTAALAAMMLLSSIAVPQTSRVGFNGQQLFLNGCNLAWIEFGRDVGAGAADTAAFAAVLQSLHDCGGNALRWWIHADGRATPAFDSTGTVSGPASGTIAGLRDILDLAWQKEIGIVLCLWSFDMLRSSISTGILDRNLRLLTDTTALRTYLDLCLGPMVDSLCGHPAIVSWEVCNEPEGMSAEFGWSGIHHVPMAAIQRFVNRCAGVIHRRDPSALVTTGAWSFRSLTDAASLPSSTDDGPISADALEEAGRLLLRKYGLPVSTSELRRQMRRIATVPNYNYYADNRLIAAGSDPVGTLDFYSVHYYEWAGTALSPLHHPVSAWALDKPLVVAEFALRPTFGVPVSRLYETLYQQGYAGALAWAWTDTSFSRRVDILASVEAMWEAHRRDVDVRRNGEEPPPVETPSAVNLSPNFPNPFTGFTVIRIQCPVAGQIHLALYDLLGREAAVLLDGSREPGTYEVIVDASRLASGAYVCRLQANGEIRTRRLILVK